MKWLAQLYVIPATLIVGKLFPKYNKHGEEGVFALLTFLFVSIEVVLTIVGASALIWWF